eukprot:jgi/Chrzof1/1061/Cz01g38260.t1
MRAKGDIFERAHARRLPPPQGHRRDLTSEAVNDMLTKGRSISSSRHYQHNPALRCCAAASVYCGPRRSRTRVANVMAFKTDEMTEAFHLHRRLYEYSEAAIPTFKPVPIDSFHGWRHMYGRTRIIPFDLSKDLRCTYPATTPNLLASFLRILAGEELQTHALATSQVFVVVRGHGYSDTEFGRIHWKQHDVFVLPATTQSITHHADDDSLQDFGPALYWVTDEPLVKYLGVMPDDPAFKPTFFGGKELRQALRDMKDKATAQGLDRIGLLLATEATAKTTRTLTHSLCAMYELLPGHTDQVPYKHGSVDAPLVVHMFAGTADCFTLLAKEIDDKGQLKDPLKLLWTNRGSLLVPPGWWHSHHNQGKEDAWLMSVQDAALYIYERTLGLTTGVKQDMKKMNKVCRLLEPSEKNIIDFIEDP